NRTDPSPRKTRRQQLRGRDAGAQRRVTNGGNDVVQRTFRPIGNSKLTQPETDRVSIYDSDRRATELVVRQKPVPANYPPEEHSRLCKGQRAAGVARDS